MTAVLKHELSLFYHNMTGYVFGAFLLLFTGIGAMIYNINASVANFEYVLSFISVVFVVIIPILTMRIIAEERRQKAAAFADGRAAARGPRRSGPADRPDRPGLH